MANILKDPVMLLSYLNTQLRDFYPDMDELCRALDLDRKTVFNHMKILTDQMLSADQDEESFFRQYDSAKNQYV